MNETAQRIQNGIKMLLDEGWQIVPMRTECGGQYAWLHPGIDDGDAVLFGCVCHKTIGALAYFDSANDDLVGQGAAMKVH